MIRKSDMVPTREPNSGREALDRIRQVKARLRMAEQAAIAAMAQEAREREQAEWEAALRAAQQRKAARRDRDRASVARVRFRVPPREFLRWWLGKNAMTMDEIMSPSRKRAVVAIRHLAIATVAKAYPRMSLLQISKLFDLDHSTIRHVLEKAGMR